MLLVLKKFFNRVIKKSTVIIYLALVLFGLMYECVIKLMIGSVDQCSRVYDNYIFNLRYNTLLIIDIM